MVKRNYYISKIEKSLGKEMIIVLVGQRRVGKSYILRELRDRKSARDDTNVIYIDKEKKKYKSNFS